MRSARPSDAGCGPLALRFAHCLFFPLVSAVQGVFKEGVAMSRCALRVCAFLAMCTLSLGSYAQLVGDTVTVNATAVDFVTLINGSAVVKDPGVEFPAPSLAENLDVTADFGRASLSVTITRPTRFAVLSHPAGVAFSVTGVDRIITGVTHTGGNVLVENLTFNARGFSFIARTADGLFPPGVTFDAQFQIATTPPQTLAGVLTGVGRPYSTAIHGGYAYIADPQAHTVWKVELANPANKTPVAGIGWKTDVEPQDWQGYNGDGIESTEAQLDNPSGVAVDSDGNVYIADTGNHAIRRIGAGASFITTVAGIPTSFAVGDPARLFAPRSVAVDAAGNVYFSDMMNQQVKKLDKATGAVSVVVGVAGRTGGNNGPVAGAEFCPPFEPAGCTLAARLNSPIGLAVDSEAIVYIADEGNNRTRKVTLGGNVSTLLSGGLLKPTGIAVTSGGGTAYIADYGNHRVLRAECNSDGCTVTTIAGTGTPGSAGNLGDPATAVQLNSPMGVTLDGNLLYIADMMNGRVVVINLTPAQ
jgi:sugar lactone lactonase YvrE